VILDLPRFLSGERPFWSELEGMLRNMEQYPRRRLSLEEVARLHYLFQRCAADLQRLSTFSAELHARDYLEQLVARAYAEIHESDQARIRFRPWHWLSWQWLGQTFPATFRRQRNAFWLALALTVGGVLFGAGAVSLDPDAKPTLMPFSQLMQSPAERVKREEAPNSDRITGHQSSFSAELMTHNIRVAVFTLALGLSWGAGTVIILFYNGVTLGAVAADYIQAGFTPFLLGWLLPHGVIEIPAILVGGQAGFVLAGALIGWGKRDSRRMRLRQVSNDLATLAGGAAVMLVWAGIVEAFFSQYHEPVLPYSLKIAFGSIELVALIAYLLGAGRRP